MWVFTSTMIWHHTHTDTCTKTHNTLMGMCISCVYYIEWIICWYQKVTIQSSTMSLLFKNYWLVEITYLLNRFSKSKLFPWNTRNTNKNGINKQNTHSPNTLKNQSPLYNGGRCSNRSMCTFQPATLRK